MDFSKHPSSVQRVINDFANCRSVGIYVHPVAGAQMPDNALSGNLQRYARQLGITASLNMVNSQKPLVQR